MSKLSTNPTLARLRARCRRVQRNRSPSANLLAPRVVGAAPKLLWAQPPDIETDQDQCDRGHVVPL
jgi:hypothetical protein